MMGVEKTGNMPSEKSSAMEGLMQQFLMLLIYAVVHSFLTRVTYSTIMDFRICAVIFIVTAVFSLYANILLTEKKKFRIAALGFLFYFVAYYFSDKAFVVIMSGAFDMGINEGGLFNFTNDLFYMLVPFITLVATIVIRMYVDARRSQSRKVVNVTALVNQILMAFVVPLVIVCVLSLATSFLKTQTASEFSTETWRTKVEQRTELLDRYLQDHDLEGLSRGRVLKDFGDPDRVDGEWIIYYNLDKEEKVLKIVFAEDEQVASFHIEGEPISYHLPQHLLLRSSIS